MSSSSKTLRRRPHWLAGLCCAALWLVCGCGEDASAPAQGGDGVDAGISDVVDGEVEIVEAPITTYDFIVTEMNFYFPEGLEPSDEQVPNPCGLDANTNNTIYQPLMLEGLQVDGFDLDGTVSEDDGGLCGQVDYAGPGGRSGVDYGFLHVIDMIRPARPGQTIQTVLASAPSQGLIKVGMRVTGVDDIQNDDEVEIFVTTTQDTPLLGTDGLIIARSSVAADPNPAFQSVFKGQIVDGVLTAGPADLAVGNIDLLVVQERVVSLKKAMIRATFTEREDGAYDVTSLVSGWWVHDEMIEALGDAILTIGANRGELDCVLDQWSDLSTDGEHCDAMSMIFEVKAVSGFITGLDDLEGEVGDASEE